MKDNRLLKVLWGIVLAIFLCSALFIGISYFTGGDNSTKKKDNETTSSSSSDKDKSKDKEKLIVLLLEFYEFTYYPSVIFTTTSPLSFLPNV